MKNKTLMKSLSALLAVVMVLCSAPLSGFVGLKFPEIKLPEWKLFDFSVKSEAATYSGSCGATSSDDVNWSFDKETGVLNITGTGRMFSYDDRMDSYYRPPWFSYRSLIETVNVFQGVTVIGEGAFLDCTSLTAIIIPDSIAFIGCDAFYRCTSLKDVYYEGDIADWVSITFDNFDRGYWDSNPLKYAEKFYVNNVLQTNIIIPDTVTKISDYAFCEFISLTSVEISNSVTHIGERAFADSGISKIVIPDSVVGVGNYAFSDCENLKAVEIADGVTCFGYCLFSGCDNISSFTIGDNYSYMDIEVFNGCGSIQNVYYTGDLQSWCKLHSESSLLRHAENLYINGTLVAGDYIIDSIPEISNSCFVDSEFSSLYLNDIKMIGEYAFAHCKKLEEVVLENITIISAYMFFDCEKLKQVYIPKSVKIIEQRAFYNCENIEMVYFEGTEEEWNLIAVYPGNINLFEAKVVFLNNTGVKPSFADKGEVSIEDITIDYKETARLSEDFKVNTSNNYKLTYKSSDESVVTVDENGYVTAIGRGSAEITVTLTDAYGNEVSDTAIVTVNTTWWQWLIIIFLFGWIWY